MDLKKAFDRVEFSSILHALREHQVSESYIHLLAALYKDQQGRVDDSDTFNILRGVKQGDTLSAIIFNCVLEFAFSKWRSKLLNHGFLMANGRRITNLRYADDVLLYGKSLPE
eukprot:10313113-Karenia_brevis.AAC.1